MKMESLEWVKAPERAAPSKPTSGGANSRKDANTAITWISVGRRLESGDTKGLRSGSCGDDGA